MTVNNLINVVNIKNELVNFLRNSDIFSTTVRGVTTATKTGTFSGDSTYTITDSNVKNVRSVVVGETTLVFGTDYTIDFDTPQIDFTSAQTGAYTIQYDYGSTDHIYGDFPRVDLGITSYPRISIAITSARTDEIALGGADTMTDFLISIYVYANGVENVDTYIKSIREVFLENKSGFYYLEFVTPVTQSPLINEPARGDKIYTRALEFRAPFNIETVT